MEAWFLACLLLAVAVGIFVTRERAILAGIPLGFFAGLIMVFLYPLMPAVASGVFEAATGATPVNVFFKGLGFFVILFPVLIFFLGYYYRVPLGFDAIFGASMLFTVSYSAILQVAFLRSIWMAIVLNWLVFTAVLVSVVLFNGAVIFWRRTRKAIREKSFARGIGIDEKPSPSGGLILGP